MVTNIWIVGLTFGLALVVFDAATARAQILGTFRWQTQPSATSCHGPSCNRAASYC
jgi:hypothetical protein